MLPFSNFPNFQSFLMIFNVILGEHWISNFPHFPFSNFPIHSNVSGGWMLISHVPQFPLLPLIFIFLDGDNLISYLSIFSIFQISPISIYIYSPLIFTFSVRGTLDLQFSGRGTLDFPFSSFPFDF